MSMILEDLNVITNVMIVLNHNDIILKRRDGTICF
jgi:hypothetical protein